MNSNLIKSHTLYHEVNLIKENFKKVNDELPDVYLAAEFINDQFDQLITTSLKNDNPSDWQFASLLMVFGSHHSWIHSYINTSIGFSDLGWMSLRRSIEFVCYLAKIKNSDKRAKLWMSKGESLKNRKEFSNVFSIPKKYFNEKYSHLKSLLVLHDYASDYGTHANFEVLMNKYDVDKINQNYIISFQDIKKNIDTSLGMVLLSGYRILQDIITVLETEIQNSKVFLKNFENASESVRKARLKIAEREFCGNIPIEVIKNINSDNKDAIEEKYQVLKDSCN
jgi:hypothetical protein